MRIELALPPRKTFLIHKRFVEDAHKAFQPSRKYSLYYRAIRVWQGITLAAVNTGANLLIWALIVTVVFTLNYFAPRYPVLDWGARAILWFFIIATLFRINKAFDDAISRPMFRLGANTLRAMLLGKALTTLRPQGRKVISVAASRGHPVNPWERFVWVFAGVVVSLLSYIFESELIPQADFP
ncbi:MAG: hypothetical protein GEV05_27540, partial [Betaproteobacteria bacterium]|nr:hypothetical protein [Betaproteobacteria bacterium]